MTYAGIVAGQVGAGFAFRTAASRCFASACSPTGSCSWASPSRSRLASQGAVRMRSVYGIAEAQTRIDPDVRPPAPG